MDVLTAFIPLVGVVLVVTVLAALTGVVSSSSRPALQYWSLHPWRIFWLSYVLILGGVLLWTVLPPVGFGILVPGMLLMYLSAIQGLRVTWMRSRRRASVIVLISFVGLVLPGLTREPQEWLLTLISSPLVILLWMFSAWLAETVGSRRVAGVSGRGRASQMGSSQETVHLAAKTASATKAPKHSTGEDLAFLRKRCPRCAETINLEEHECRYCQHPFQPQEVATDIRQALAERAKEVAARIDFSSTTRTCPKCAETIKMEALVCRYCGCEFTDPMVQVAKVSALRAARNPIYEVPDGAQIQVTRSDYTAKNRMRNRKIGLSAILVGLLLALAPIPFLEFDRHPGPGLEAYISPYIKVREEVWTPRFEPGRVIPYRVLLVAALGLVLLGFGAILWPARPRGCV